MRYIDLEVTYKWSMEVSRYRHKYKGFYENVIFSKFIDEGRTTIIRVPM